MAMPTGFQNTPDKNLAAIAKETGFSQCVYELKRTLTTTPAGWLLVAWMCWDSVPHLRIGGWLAFFMASWLLNLWVLQSVIRKGPNLSRHALPVLGVASLDGIAWGMAVWLLMGYNAILDPWLSAILCGVGAANAPAYITYIKGFRVQIFSIWVVALIASGLHMERINVWVIVAGLSLFYALIVFYMHSIAQRVLEGIRLQAANANLAEQLRAALTVVEHDAETDMLTGQANRRALDIMLGQQMQIASEGRKTFSVLMVDIDFFKQINDTHGHGVGDDTLRAITRRLRTFLRQGDVCTRYGGEEFVVVLPNTRLKTAEEVAERLRSGIDEEVLLTTPLVKATVSIGVAEYSVGCSVKQLLNYADEAMYAAKRGGRNQVRAHSNA